MLHFRVGGVVGGERGQTLGKRVTEQWYACPAKTPTPRMTELCATCRFTTKSAPELMPEMVMPSGSMSSAGRGGAGELSTPSARSSSGMWGPSAAAAAQKAPPARADRAAVGMWVPG